MVLGPVYDDQSLASYMILWTRSNSPSSDASNRSARGLNFTLRPWPVRSDVDFFKLVRLTWEDVCLFVYVYVCVCVCVCVFVCVCEREREKE